MSHRSRSRKFALVAVLGLGASLSLAACGGDSTDGDADTGAGGDASFKLCMGVGGKDDGSMAQGDAAEALAKKNGWEYFELNNNSDGPTANKNVDQFVQNGCSVVMEFNYAGTQEVIQAKLKAADIPGITFDLPQEGMYLVAVDNKAAGEGTGVGLGNVAQEKWDCDVDLVMLGEQANAGAVNELRVGGTKEGLLETCPDIPDSAFVNFEGGATVDTATAAARDVLVANPDAKRILTGGIGDNTVFAALQAAEQLGRGGDILGWGQGAYLLSGDDTPDGLVGDAVYFFEDYPIEAVEQIVTAIADGDAPEMADSLDNAAVLVPACVTDRQQTLDMPVIGERVKQLTDDNFAKSGYETFCPSA